MNKEERKACDEHNERLHSIALDSYADPMLALMSVADMDGATPTYLFYDREMNEDVVFFSKGPIDTDEICKWYRR